jgi:hypothetical protein
MMDEFIVDDLASNRLIELMPFIQKKHRICDLTPGDVRVILDGIEEFEKLIEDLRDDLPTGLISGLEQLEERLGNTGLGYTWLANRVHWHCPCLICLIHCRLISFSSAGSS